MTWGKHQRTLGPLYNHLDNSRTRSTFCTLFVFKCNMRPRPTTQCYQRLVVQLFERIPLEFEELDKSKNFTIVVNLSFKSTKKETYHQKQGEVTLVAVTEAMCVVLFDDTSDTHKRENKSDKERAIHWSLPTTQMARVWEI